MEHFSKEAYKRTVIGKRKTIQRRDLGKLENRFFKGCQ